MRKGEKGILGAIAIGIVGMAAVNYFQSGGEERGDTEIPFYTTASPELQRQATQLMRELDCRDCHSLWTVSSRTQNVPAPPLDGIGSLRSETWFYDYLSAEDPQSILPTRLKQKYEMPSYAHVDEKERRILAQYLASLKVEDWYLEETKKREYEKLTGKQYPQGGGSPR